MSNSSPADRAGKERPVKKTKTERIRNVFLDIIGASLSGCPKYLTSYISDDNLSEDILKSKPKDWSK
jgi:hypothetical protein